MLRKNVLARQHVQCSAKTNLLQRLSIICQISLRTEFLWIFEYGIVGHQIVNVRVDYRTRRDEVTLTIRLESVSTVIITHSHFRVSRRRSQYIRCEDIGHSLNLVEDGTSVRHLYEF